MSIRNNVIEYNLKEYKGEIFICKTKKVQFAFSIITLPHLILHCHWPRLFAFSLQHGLLFCLWVSKIELSCLRTCNYLSFNDKTSITNHFISFYTLYPLSSLNVSLNWFCTFMRSLKTDIPLHFHFLCYCLLRFPHFLHPLDSKIVW